MYHMNGSISCTMGGKMRCSTSFVALCLLISVVTSFPRVTYIMRKAVYTKSKVATAGRERLHRCFSCYRCNPVASHYLSLYRGGHPKKGTATARRISNTETVTNNDGDGTTTLTFQNVDNDANTNALQGKTVKELIHIAKSFPEYTSKIRLKKDLLEFVTIQKQKLLKQQQHQKDQQRVRQKRLPTMPSYQPTIGNLVYDSNVEDELSDLFVSTSSCDMPSHKGLVNETGIANDSKRPLSKKELLYDFVIHRYPPLQHMSVSLSSPTLGSGVDMEDIRAQHHPMLTYLNKTSSDLDIVLIGTASCVPSSTRGVSCTALRLNWRRNKGQRQNPQEETSSSSSYPKQNYFYNDKDYVFESGTWLFDCGECTQLQLQRTSYVKAGKITKIFVTHAHGDHTFGLPGLLCLLGKDRPRDAPPLEIYGPEGLRMWLRVAIRYSVSRIVPNYVVHELKNIPMAPEWRHAAGWHKSSNKGRFILTLTKNQLQDIGEPHMLWGPRGLAGEDPSAWISQFQTVNLQEDQGYGELYGGRDIYPQFNHPDCVYGAPIWEVEDEGDVSVYAAPMSHGIPCVGYVVKEQNRPGRLRPDLVAPIIKRNYQALQESVIKNPMKIMALIKNLPVGSAFTFPDGTVVKQSDVVQPPIQGRKIVILGDTLDPRAIEGLARDADVLIHEATNTYLSGIDSGTNLEEVTLDCKRHGHSTPYMAGEFAKRIGAKRLILNHFSARYKGDQSLDSIAIMTRIERQAIKASGLPETHVATGWDFMILPVIAHVDEKL